MIYAERIQAVWAVLQQDITALPAGGGLSTYSQTSFWHFSLRRKKECFGNDNRMMVHYHHRRHEGVFIRVLGKG